jgi:hypothetical protein
VRKSYRSWVIYSFAIFIAWAVVFLIRWGLKGVPSLEYLALIFFGFFVGWLSATIKFILVNMKLY